MRKFTLSFDLNGSTLGHASDDSSDVGLSHIAIFIEVIYLKDKLHFLVECRTVKSQQTRQKFFRAQISIFILIHDCEKTFSNKSWQLAVVTERDSVNSLGFVVTATTQIFEDVSEVRQTHSHLEVFGLNGLSELQRQLREVIVL